VCGQGPATTTQALEGALFDGLPHSQPQTVQGAFRACSYGNADFSRASGVEVLSLTVPIPCTGKTPWSLPYDSKSCPYIGECLFWGWLAGWCVLVVRARPRHLCPREQGCGGGSCS
jgi:hypothetical protein